MTQEEIIEMARQAGIRDSLEYDHMECDIESLEAFAKLVEQHVRNTMNEEAKAHLEELRKNFNAESAELRLHQWSQEKHA
jgi:hypothetical protein